MSSAAGILGNLRIIVDADTSKAQMAMRKMGGQAGVLGATIGAGLGVAAVAGLRIGDEYKKATDAIRVGTGATGDDLAALESSFKSVAGRVPQDIGTVGQALADVNTRTGATGDQLETLTESFLDMSRLLNVDTSTAIANITRMYGDWSVATTDQVAANDMLLRASQAAGIGVDRLSAQMVQFGAPLRNIGIEFDGAIAMLAKWEKEGVNTELALGGLKIALGEFAKEGTDAKLGLEDLIERIAQTDDEARAMAIGVGKFGSRAGPDMVAAIREGRLEFADFAEQLASGTETVQGLSDDTRDMGDAIREAMNRVKVAIGPVTDSFAGIADAMGNAIFLLPALGGALGNAIGRMWTKAAGTKAGLAAAAAAGKLAGAAYSAAAAVGGKLMAAVIALWNMMGGKRVLALAAAAGTKAGAAYSAAAGLAMKAGMLVKAGWAAAASGIGAVMGSGIAAAALPIISLALVALAGKMAVDLAHNIGEWQGELQEKANGAVNQAAGEAITNLENLTTHMSEVQGLGRVLGDTFGGKQQADGLLNLARAIAAGTDMTADEIRRAGVALEAAAHEAGARGNAAVREQILMVKAQVDRQVGTVEAAYDPLSSITVPAPTIAAPIRQEFQLATAEVAAGFGSVKQALANPPQMISKGDRLANMAKRMKKVMANIKKATEVGDPMAQRYWEKARAKQQQQIDKLKGKTTASLSSVKSAYRKAGVAVQGTWTKTKTKTVNAAKTAADGAIAETERVPTAVEAMDLTSAGTNLMGTWANGMMLGIPQAVAAAESAAAAVAAVTVGSSPPPKGPLSKIDKGGRNVMDAWLSGFDPRRAGKVGARVAGALKLDAALGGAMLGMGAGGMAMAMAGGGDTFHIGTLVADEGGLDQLEHRMSRRRKRRSRTRRITNDAN